MAVVTERLPAFSLYSEAATARTATGNSATQSIPGHIREAFVGVNVTAVSGTGPTLTVQFQQQDANGIWQTLAATSSITAVSTVALNLPEASYSFVGGGSYRVRWVIGGTSPSFTFQVGIHGR